MLRIKLEKVDRQIIAAETQRLLDQRRKKSFKRSTGSKIELSRFSSSLRESTSSSQGTSNYWKGILEVIITLHADTIQNLKKKFDPLVS